MPRRSRKKIPLFDLKLPAGTKREVTEVLSSGWLTSGPKVAAFEKAVARLLRIDHAAAVNSCTTGLQLALTACGAGSGVAAFRGNAPIREVITSAFTFAATIEAILHAGALPVLADIRPDTLNLDPLDVERKISDRTAAVVAVDIAGHPCEYESLNRLCNEDSTLLLSDAAHAIGARYRKMTIPNCCDAAVTSFYSTKNLTCGEGGMVLSQHKQLIDRVRILARHGLTSATYERRKEKTLQYDAIACGYKANMSDLHAAVGLGQLKSYARDQKARTELAARYIRNLSDLHEVVELPMERKGCIHGWHLFIVKLNLSRLKLGRDDFISKMAQRGVECGVHYQPVIELSWYRDRLGVSPQHLPQAVAAGQRVVSLPLYPGLKKTDVDFVCECLESIVRKHAK